MLLNYRNGKWNFFLNYSINSNKGFADLYALRSYYKDDGITRLWKGLPIFKQADEYFKLTRDSRVCTIGFTFCLGKSFKTIPKRSAGGADDEIERVGTGN